MQALVGPKFTRGLELLQFDGSYGVQKRSETSNNKYETKTEKQRRGPLNGLIPGGAFGRATRSSYLRSDCRFPTYDKLIKLLRAPLKPYFEYEGVKDRMPINVEAYKFYQYKPASKYI